MGASVRRGSDVLGSRYVRIGIDGPIEVYVVVHDNAALVEPGIDQRVEMMARLALDEVRSSAAHQREP